MTVDVQMLAFSDAPNVMRSVVLPEDWEHTSIGRTLGAVYEHGQNCVQPQPLPSVSVGDVIHIWGCAYAVSPVGFLRLYDLDLLQLERTPRRDRADLVRQWVQTAEAWRIV